MNFEFIVYSSLASFQIQNGGCVIRSIQRALVSSFLPQGGREGCQSFLEFISASSHFCLNDASRAIFSFCLNRDAVVQVMCGVLVTSCGIYTQDSQHPDLKRTIKFVKHA